MQFNDTTIRQLFGTDTAEDEDSARLKQYFFRNKAYENIRSSLPLRILVGHKGIGKSALLRMSHLEDVASDQLSLWLLPDHLILENSRELTFIEKIRGYKILLSRAIFSTSLEKLGVVDFGGEASIGFQNTAKQLLAAVTQKFTASIGGSFDEETSRLRRVFSRDREIRIYIDDIDRGWSAHRDDINNISALVNAARDLANDDPRLKIRIGLRSDAYFLYRTSDESTDKVESNVIRLQWTRHDILLVMALRVASFFGQKITPEELQNRSQTGIASELHPVLEKTFSVGRGHWDGAPTHQVLLSLNRNRPRDLIKLLTEAAKEAYKNDHQVIKARDLEAVFSNYSHGRMNDLVLEFRSELPQIEALLYNMGPTRKQSMTKEKRWVYDNGELIRKLRNIKLNHSLSFTNNRPATEKHLAEFLYKIDFLIARDIGPNGQPRWTHFDQNRLLQSQFVDFGYHWEVHPAYRWALQPKTVHEILESVDLINQP